MEIQNKNSLIHAMKTGINVFVGAGFSLYAYDKKKQKLPSGNGLADELKSMFNVKASSLSMISTILQRKAKTEFKAFLTERFSVGDCSHSTGLHRNAHHYRCGRSC